MFNILARKKDYFSKIKGFVYYDARNPNPKLGEAKDFVIYGISQSQGKIESIELASDESPFLKAQKSKS